LIEHVGADSFYGFLARKGDELFRDRDFADLYGERGRPSVPPSQMCVLLVLQARDGTSDQEAVDRTAYDIRWKVALGVELEEKLCAKSTLQLFRANLLLNERFLRLFEASVRACRREGLVKSRKLEVAIDSTPVFGRGAVKDTYNLVSDALRRVVMDSCKLKGWEVEEVVSEQGLGRHFGSSVKGESDLDWSDEQERRTLLRQLVADAHVALQLAKRALRGYATDAVKAREVRVSVELLVRILGQDIEDDPDDGEGPRIRKGTAKDRILSTTDPEMRHGHKSHSKGFNGYKASVVVETKSGVILSTGVQPGNRSDREPAVELIEEARVAAGSRIGTALGDTAYGDIQTRSKLSSLGVEVVAKTPPIPSKRGAFKRTAFGIDKKRGRAKCPANKISIRRTRTRADDGWSYFFSRNDCTGCPLRSECTTSSIRARTVTVLDNSMERDRLLRHQKTKRFRKRYRRRVAAEHAIARLVRHGIRQAKYFGSKKTEMQVALAAMAVNLGLLASYLDLGHFLRALMRIRAQSPAWHFWLRSISRSSRDGSRSSFVGRPSSPHPSRVGGWTFRQAPAVVS
jgi:transposase